MQYQFRITSPQAKGVYRDVLVDGEMSFLDFHFYLARLLSLGVGGVASFFVCDKSWCRGTEITMFEDEESVQSQRPMASVRLREYVHSDSARFEYIFGMFFDNTLRIEAVRLCNGTLGEDVPVCVGQRGDFHFEEIDPLLRNMNDIDELMREIGGDGGSFDDE